MEVVMKIKDGDITTREFCIFFIGVAFGVLLGYIW
jgi:hypothetical protein